MSVLYLDIDGVLNTWEWRTAAAQKLPSNFVRLPTDQQSVEQLSLLLNPDQVRLVNSIVKRTGCKVILSSSWNFPVEKMAGVFSALGGEFQLSGRTPRKMSSTRFNEIFWSLRDDYPEDGFAILDDIDTGLPNQCLCKESEGGLTSELADLAVKFLMSPRPNIEKAGPSF